MTTTWLLLAHLTLSTGESVDTLVSMHSTEEACIRAIPDPIKGQRKRRYDCRPMPRLSAEENRRALAEFLWDAVPLPPDSTIIEGKP
jgi:hypothetical protein